MDAQNFVKRLGDLSSRCTHLSTHCRGASMAWDRGGIIADGLDVLNEVDKEVETLLDAAFELDGGLDVLGLIEHLQALRKEIDQAVVWVKSLAVDAGRYAADDAADVDVDDEIYHRAEMLTSLVCRKVFCNSLQDYARRIQNRLRVKPVQDGVRFRIDNRGDAVEVFYRNKPLPIPPGKTMNLFYKLHCKMPEAASYDELDGRGVTGGASDQLRNDKKNLLKILKEQETPYTVETLAGHGYRLASQ